MPTNLVDVISLENKFLSDIEALVARGALSHTDAGVEWAARANLELEVLAP
jgi:hypothetical protein